MPMLLVRSKCARISRGVYMLTRLYVIVVRFINTILMHSKCARISSVYMLTRLCVIVVRFINTILTPCRCCWCARWSIVDWISKTLTNGPLSGCWKPTLTWMHRGTRLINHHKQKQTAPLGATKWSTMQYMPIHRMHAAKTENMTILSIKI